MANLIIFHCMVLINTIFKNKIKIKKDHKTSVFDNEPFYMNLFLT